MFLVRSLVVSGSVAVFAMGSMVVTFSLADNMDSTKLLVST